MGGEKPGGAPPDGAPDRAPDAPPRRRPVVAATALAITLVSLAVIASLWDAPSLSESANADKEARTADLSVRSGRRPPIAAGHDISWPNCPHGTGRLRPLPGLPLPTRTGRFVVVGLTEGPGFYPNPCLGQLVAWAKRHRLPTAAYAVTSYPTAAERRRYGSTGPYPANSDRAELHNVGFTQARVNLESMRNAGLASLIIWIDVEPVALRPWSTDRQANRAVIEGATRAYQEAGLRVGFYSFPTGWADIVGSWRLPNHPVWATAATAGRERALGKCAEPSFAGGPVVLVQWHDDRHDYDATCPGVTMADYFAPP